MSAHKINSKNRLIQIIFVVGYVIFFTSFFVFLNPNFNNKIDGSWQYSIGGLKNSPQHLGSEIFFTYGPLSEKIITTVNHGDTSANYALSVLLFILIITLNTAIFYKFIKLVYEKFEAERRYLLTMTMVVLLFSLTSLDSFFYLTLLFTIYIGNLEKNYYKKILILLGIFIFSLYKFNFTVPTLLLSPIVFIDRITIKRISLGVFRWIPALLLYIVIFLALTKPTNLKGFFTYLQLGIFSSIGYTEFMNLPYEQHLKLILFFATIILLNGLIFGLYIVTRLKRKLLTASDQFILLSPVYLLILFLTYKHSIVRSDIHLLNFTPFIFLTFAYLFLCLQLLYPDLTKIKLFNHKASIILITMAAILSCAFHLFLVVKVEEYNLDGRIKYTTGLKSHINSRLTILRDGLTQNQLNYRDFLEKKEAANTQGNKIRDDLVETKKKLRDLNYNGELVFYGNSTMFAEFIKPNYKILYMPYLQTYAAFPPRQADDIYIKYLENHPDNLVFAEEYEPSIDERIPSHELSNYFQYLIHNYELIYSNPTNKQFIYKRISSNKELCQTVTTSTSYDNRPIEIPNVELSKTEYLKLKINSSNRLDSVIDVGLGLFVKKPVLSIGLINHDGTFTRHTTRSTLEHGISIKPLYQSLSDYNIKKPYEVKSVVISDDLITKADYLVQFEKCSFQ